MRGYGRFIKNISAMLLLVALLSLLLPFCHFQAKGQDITLSGIEVLTAGGKAGYVYWKDGNVTQQLKMGNHVKILHRTILQLGSSDTLHLY